MIKKPICGSALAVDSGHLVSNNRLDAQHDKDKLAELLSTEAIIEVQEMAQRCHNSGYKNC